MGYGMDDHPHPSPAALAVSDLLPAAHLFVAIPPSQVVGFQSANGKVPGLGARGEP